MPENTPTGAGMSDEDFVLLVLRHLDDSLDETGTSALHAELLRDAGRRREFVSLHLRSVKLAELLRPQLFDDPENSAPATLDDAQILPALNALDRGDDGNAERKDSAGMLTGLTAPRLPDDSGSDSTIKAAGPIEDQDAAHAWRWPWRVTKWRAGALGWAAAATVVLASAISLVVILHPGAHPEPLVMGASLDAVWADPRSVAAAGSLVETGVSQSLESGCAELTASNGLVVVIQGPATFTVVKAGVVALSSGRLTASVPKPARGFTVNTPVARVIDLGTEFGVSVDPSGETQVQTFRGTVSLSSSTSPPSVPAGLITAGVARRVSSTGDITDVPANTTAFVRPQQFDDWNAMPHETSFDRWKAYSARLRSDPDLVAYYTFDRSESDPERLINLAASGPALNGFLRGTDRIHERPLWTTGRWPEKGALAFTPNSHERVEIESPVGGPLDFSRNAQTAVPFTICVWLRRTTAPGSLVDFSEGWWFGTVRTGTDCGRIHRGVGRKGRGRRSPESRFQDHKQVATGEPELRPGPRQPRVVCQWRSGGPKPQRVQNATAFRVAAGHRGPRISGENRVLSPAHGGAD